MLGKIIKLLVLCFSMKPINDFKADVDLSNVAVPKWIAEVMYKQGYRFVGGHSAIKICEWTRKCIRCKGNCYKQKFYGIDSHRCVQMSPAVMFCDFNCVHCWRSLDFRLPESDFKWDTPEKIYEGCIEAQRKVIQGFRGVGHEEEHEGNLSEAEEPMHFAISLSGEPCLYPHLPEFIELLKKKGKSAFLVTNGAHPEMIERLLPEKYQPTNLYLTLPGPDENTFEDECGSKILGGWDKIHETLALLRRFSCRTVVRLTLSKKTNMHSPEKYAEIVDEYGPDFVECKGYMAIGGAREKMGPEAMPWHDNLREFAREIEKYSSYSIKDEKEDSCVVLLSK